MELEGGLATTLIKSEWTYGRGAAALRRNIVFGIPGTEMVAWGEILKPTEITEVVDFILNAQNIPINAVREVPTSIVTQRYQLQIEELSTEGLEDPWSIEFVDESNALISEKKGRLRWLKNGSLDPKPIKGLPTPFLQASTAGFMDLALDPDYQDNGWVYLAYSYTNGDNDSKQAPVLTKVIRGKVEDYQWVDQQTLFEVPDSLMAVRGNRWGCRFLFDDEGFLFFTIGDMGMAMDSQDPKKATGKIFRINPDGSIPKDNPFINTPNAQPAVYTLGNRNTQGLAQHPETKEIWFTDHGPMGGDEVNILKKGANYGWPLATFGVDYDGAVVSDKSSAQGMEDPVTHWTPSIAACAAEFSNSPLFSHWQNNLLIGALGFEELRRLTIENKQVIGQEILLKGFGRVRDVKFSPDGALYLVLNRPAKILRIVPVSDSN
jgi:glucose/arabinose dehydrogenase